MIVSINQPAYLPWLGYFNRIAVSDVHVILDHVQFEKNSFTNRNKVRTKEGSVMLTIPVKTKGLFENLAINKIEISDDNWRIKHQKTIQSVYSRASYFKKYESILSQIYGQSYEKLIDIMIPMNAWLSNELGIDTAIVRSSEMDIGGTKSELVLNICKELKATTYLSGSLGVHYLDVRSFEEAGIEVIFDNYQHPVYTQVYPGFEPYMSILDLLLNEGPNSKEVFLSDILNQ